MAHRLVVAATVRLATDSEGIVFAGRRGTGKTTEALNELSQRSFDEMPWVTFDFKHNDLLAACPVNGIVSLYDPPPTDPGLWTVRVKPEDFEQATGGRLDRYFEAMVDRGNIGALIDEGQLLGQQNRGLRSLIILGRSKRVPYLFVCQRTVRVETTVWSESEIFHFFQFQHPRDYEVLADHIDPDTFNADTLRAYPPRHSFRYEPVTGQHDILPPCDPFEVIRERILARLPVYEHEGGPPRWLPETRVRL